MNPTSPPRLTCRALRVVLVRHITDLTGISGVLSVPLLQDYAPDNSVVISESFLETFMSAREDFPSGETWDFVQFLSNTAVVSTARTAQVLTTTWVKLSRNTPV